MLGRQLGSTLLLLGALALAACSTPSSDSPAFQDSPATSAPSMSSSESPEAVETPSGQETPSDDAAPAAPTEGAYVEYADGVIEQTAGAKVLFFHAPWCPQCRKLDEQLLGAGAPDGTHGPQSRLRLALGPATEIRRHAADHRRLRR